MKIMLQAHGPRTSPERKCWQNGQSNLGLLIKFFLLDEMASVAGNSLEIKEENCSLKQMLNFKDINNKVMDILPARCSTPVARSSKLSSKTASFASREEVVMFRHESSQSPVEVARYLIWCVRKLMKPKNMFVGKRCEFFSVKTDTYKK